MQRARLPTCTAVTKNTLIHESTRGYICGIGYIPTLAVFPYNTMIYYSRLKSNYLPLLRDLTPLNKFPTSFGAVCRIDVLMTWICASETKISQADGIPQFFRPCSTNLLVSVGQTTRQKIDHFYGNEAFQWVSTERLLISSNWRWYLLQRIGYCSHVTL